MNSLIQQAVIVTELANRNSFKRQVVTELANRTTYWNSLIRQVVTELANRNSLIRQVVTELAYRNSLIRQVVTELVQVVTGLANTTIEKHYSWMSAVGNRSHFISQKQ
jgi:hypothetical protein